MANLTEEQQTFVVTSLAQFNTPSQVVELVKENWPDLDLTRQAVRHYIPDQSPDLAPEWRELFEAEREKFIAGTAEIAGSHQSWRMKELVALYRGHASRNPVLAADLLEQMAKESGGMFTNRRELTGAGGGPIQTEGLPFDITKLSPAQLEQFHDIVATATATDETNAPDNSVADAGGNKRRKVQA